jgi:hypothetical protein
MTNRFPELEPAIVLLAFTPVFMYGQDEMATGKRGIIRCAVKTFNSGADAASPAPTPGTLSTLLRQFAPLDLFKEMSGKSLLKERRLVLAEEPISLEIELP